jgi:hypothetical protein
MSYYEGQTLQWQTKGMHINIQNITQKNKNRGTRIPLKPEVALRCSVRVRSSCSKCQTLHFNVVKYTFSLGKSMQILLLFA